jgi:hypothetical protein
MKVQKCVESLMYKEGIKLLINKEGVLYLRVPLLVHGALYCAVVLPSDLLLVRRARVHRVYQVGRVVVDPEEVGRSINFIFFFSSEFGKPRNVVPLCFTLVSNLKTLNFFPR